MSLVTRPLTKWFLNIWMARSVALAQWLCSWTNYHRHPSVFRCLQWRRRLVVRHVECGIVALLREFGKDLVKGLYNRCVLHIWNWFDKNIFLIVIICNEKILHALGQYGWQWAHGIGVQRARLFVGGRGKTKKCLLRRRHTRRPFLSHLGNWSLSGKLTACILNSLVLVVCSWYLHAVVSFYLLQLLTMALDIFEWGWDRWGMWYLLAGRCARHGNWFDWCTEKGLIHVHQLIFPVR